MQSTIEEIYYGNVRDFESTPLTWEYTSLNGIIYEKINNLKKELNDDQIRKLDEVYEMFIRLSCEYGKERYIKGFKRGLRLGIELEE